MKSIDEVANGAAAIFNRVGIGAVGSSGICDSNMALMKRFWRWFKDSAEQSRLRLRTLVGQCRDFGPWFRGQVKQLVKQLEDGIGGVDW